MNDEFECRYKPSRETMGPAYAYLLRAQPVRLWTRIGMGIVFIVAAAVEIYWSRQVVSPRYFSGVSVVLVVIGTYFIFSPLVWKFVFMQHFARGGEVKLFAGPEGVRGEVNGRETKEAWTAAQKIREGTEGILLFFGRESFLWLPAGGFSSPEEFTEARKCALAARESS